MGSDCTFAGNRLLELGRNTQLISVTWFVAAPLRSPLRPDARLTLRVCNLVPADVTLNTGLHRKHTHTPKRMGGPSDAATLISGLQPFQLQVRTLLMTLAMRRRRFYTLKAF
jgi:hypothetical protein